MASVGVRELRQNLSRYLDRVKDGEALDVTEHGRVVARLSPAGERAPAGYQRLTRDTGASVPTGSVATVLAALPAHQAPAGTTDELLGVDRRDRH